MNSDKISWPAILHYHGENELTYIASQSEWDNDADLHVGNYEENDRLIDCQGSIYQLNQRRNNVITPQQSDLKASLKEVTELVKAHLSEQGSCCVSKLFASSFAEAIAIAFPDKL